MNTWRSRLLVSFVLAAVGGCALSADPGERGLPGEPGADGTNGSPGGKGQDGDDGTDGKDGMPGTDGAAGVSPFMGPDPNDGSIYYNGGNVGIGTMTPGNPLEVHATAAGGPVAQFESPNVSSYLKIRATGFNGSDWLVGADTLGGTTAGFSIYDVTSNAYRMFIDGSGRVGIGTAIPEAPLHVAVLNDAPLLTLERTGQVSDGKWSLAPNATGLFFLDDTGVQAGAGPTRVFFASDGKVGIGTTTPDAVLDVKGGIKSTIGVTDGTNIAVARAHSSYMINVSSNGDVGLAVRAGIYHVLLSEDPAPTVAFVAPISVLNGQTATFSVVGGMLTISGLSPGNNKVSVLEN